MPKKKKKSRGSTGDNVVANSVSLADASSTLTEKASSPPRPIVDVLSLQLSTPTSSVLFAGSKKSLKYSPTLFLHASDAEQLDVVAGDKVFVLGHVNDGEEEHEEKPTLVKSAVAKVKIIGDATEQQAPGTPRTPLFKKSEKIKASRPGSCHLYPSTLADAFLLAGKESSQESVAPPSTPNLKSPPIASATLTTVIPSSTRSSSSKSKFSFAIGGGWDNALASPSPSKSQEKHTPSSAKKYSQKICDIWIVPVDSDIGNVVSSTLCRTASLIQLREHFDPPMPDENDVENSHSRHFGSWAKRLVIAHTVGEYLSCGTLFAVSMQGQKVKLKMSEATVEALDPFGRRENKDTQSTTDLVTNMEQLSIQNGTASLESSVKLVVQSLNDDKKNALLLYQIRHDTTIQCENHENAPDDDLTKVSSQPLKPLVAGLESIVTQVQSALVVPLLHPELFFNEGSSSQKSVLKPPKGILLHGPSGVGKSSLALQVGQNLESSGQFHVERVHCTLLQSQTAFVGQAERELVKLFEKAQVPRPGKKGCLLILDEVHLICPCRQGNDLGADRLASTLLALLDGIGTESSTGDSASKRFYPTVILAVTTNPGMLDAALRRPGRLDSEIEVPIPDEPATKANILQFHLDNLGANTSTITEDNWLSLAGRAKGFTGADLKLAAKEAVRKCAIQDPHADSSVMTLEILQQAVACVKPSAIKAVTVEVPRVPWTSIGGMDDVKTQLREAIELPLTHGDMFEKLGIRPPRGVLLYGPPGCSKTLMARALATEGHMNFLAVKGPELLSKWLGESERALAALFRRARLASPAVIFFDEVDAIASRRGGGGGGGERLLSQLLTELDGIQHGSGAGSKERVVIVCATNRPDLLDGALMRPGRIDRMIYVGVPDASSRERILRIGLKGKACATDIDFAQLVDEKVSGGLSGAELIAACRDAALKAMEEYEDAKEKRGETDEDPMMSQQVPMIRMDHLTTALMEMEHQITPEMLEFYASFQGKKLA